MFGVRQKTGQQENRFTRNGNAGILQEQRCSHSPISILHHRIPQQVEDGVGHKVFANVQEQRGYPTGALPTTANLLFEEVNQRFIELLRTLFIRQVSNPPKNNLLHMGKIPGQRFHRGYMHRRVFIPPH